MSFSYKPLWKMLIDHDMTKKELMTKANISKSTMDKMGRCENVSLDIIDKLCSYFKCDVSDIMTYVPREDKTNETT